MDYLQQIIDDIPNRNKTKTIDITDIIPKPNLRKADNYQLPKIIGICEEPSRNIKILRINQDIDDNVKYMKIREIEDSIIEQLEKLKINDNTIRIILYRAFSENEKYCKNEYREMRRHLASWLYQAQPETFKQVIDMSKKN
jgi:hypothetical protein